jgi:hypothetical protein
MSLVLEMVNFSIVFTNSILLMHASFYFLKFSDFSIPIMNPSIFKINDFLNFKNCINTYLLHVDSEFLLLFFLY